MKLIFSRRYGGIFCIIKEDKIYGGKFMNTFLNSLFATLFFIFLIVAVVGLVNPRWVTFGRMHKNRKATTLIYCGAAVISLLLTALFPTGGQ